MPLDAWVATKATLHRFEQIVGKIRLAASPRRNHWWNVPFHLTGRGITTRPMGWDPVFAIDFDFVDHRLLVNAVDGGSRSFPLEGQSVASFYRLTTDALRALGIDVSIDRPVPFDLPEAIPFAEDTKHAAYDPEWAGRYWRVLIRVAMLLEEFAAGFSGKTSPVHHFWHTLDIAVTRFSDRHVDQPPTVDSVTREAYSREVVSFGFWFGDDTFREPAFYSYTAPEPEGLATDVLRPEGPEGTGGAVWAPRGSSHLAVYRYEDARAAADPRRSVLGFYESAYQAGARRAGWPVDELASPGGVSDPVLRAAAGSVGAA